MCVENEATDEVLQLASILAEIPSEKRQQIQSEMAFLALIEPGETYHSAAQRIHEQLTQPVGERL